MVSAPSVQSILNYYNDKLALTHRLTLQEEYDDIGLIRTTNFILYCGKREVGKLMGICGGEAPVRDLEVWLHGFIACANISHKTN